MFLQDQLNEYGIMHHAYETMHLKCVQPGYVVTQEATRTLLKLHDPLGECST